MITTNDSYWSYVEALDNAIALLQVLEDSDGDPSAIADVEETACALLELMDAIESEHVR